MSPPTNEPADNMQEKDKQVTEEEIKEKAITLARALCESYPTLQRYWELGEAVNQAVSKKAGDRKTIIFKEISEDSGLSNDSIRKAERFYRNYRDEVVSKKLYDAGSHVSWHLVANNLRIEPGEFIPMCQKTDNYRDLNKLITIWKGKHPDNRGGKKNRDNNGEENKQADGATTETETQALVETKRKVRQRLQDIRILVEKETPKEEILKALDEIMQTLQA